MIIEFTTDYSVVSIMSNIYGKGRQMKRSAIYSVKITRVAVLRFVVSCSAIMQINVGLITSVCTSTGSYCSTVLNMYMWSAIAIIIFIVW